MCLTQSHFVIFFNDDSAFDLKTYLTPRQPSFEFVKKKNNTNKNKKTESKIYIDQIK